MICPKCCQDRDSGDFFTPSDLCYKCIYQEKSAKYAAKSRTKKCRICGEVCEENRWVYCSKDCSVIGENQQKKEYWTAKIRSI